jgi:hypothetical protein
VVDQIIQGQTWKVISDDFDLNIINQNYIKEIGRNQRVKNQIKNECMSDIDICLKYRISFTTLKTIRP